MIKSIFLCEKFSFFCEKHNSTSLHIPLLDFLPLINELVCENCLLRTCAIHLHCRFISILKIAQTNKGVAAWPDVPKGTLGNLTPADRHGSVQVRVGVFPKFSVSLFSSLFSLHKSSLALLTSKLQSQNHSHFLSFSKITTNPN